MFPIFVTICVWFFGWVPGQEGASPTEVVDAGLGPSGVQINGNVKARLPTLPR